jgi:hypothetical protein
MLIRHRPTSSPLALKLMNSTVSNSVQPAVRLHGERALRWSGGDYTNDAARESA